jgi:hypothetical protein
VGDSCEKGNKSLGSISDGDFLVRFGILDGADYEDYGLFEHEKM